jgi:signal transduction histidine kinase
VAAAPRAGDPRRLRGVPGIAQLADAAPWPDSLALVDVGGTSLAEAPKPLPAGELVRLAAGLARAIGEMHRRGVLHRDIAPANIVVAPDGTPLLVDFVLATSSAEVRPEFTHHRQIVGTLPYLAPEQTGRIGRSVDERADLYALGATLYELATGAPPFGSGDPLRLAHDHLARVPTPPAEVDPAVPAWVSEIILHLLEKEPDNRYQSAEGLLHDLESGRASSSRVGAHDVPRRVLAPSRLIGREQDTATLEAAFAAALAGGCRGVLIGGTPGVGKTALADGLRPAVTRAHGWFVAGKFDQHRRDLDFDATNQALRALGRLLLAETDAALAEVRERILAATGANAALLTATVPELAGVLGVAPDPGDPLTAQVRMQRAIAQALRAASSPERPLVVLVDDLQWAGRTPIGAIDLLLREDPVPGLLLIGAFRDVDAVHRLAGPLSRWRRQPGVEHVRLADLPSPDLVSLVAEVLRTDEAAASGLVDAIEPHTRGNPYETIELLDALRRDGLLTASADGWRWDVAALLAHLGRSGPPSGRVAVMPTGSRELLEAMACLGGRADLGLLQAATGEPAEVVDARLAPALDEGLLIAEAGAPPAVRFRHDRVREEVLQALDPERRSSLQLALAQRLARVPELFAAAAGQYLPVAAELRDRGERLAAARLLRRAADQAAMIGDHARVDVLLAAAVQLVDPAVTATVVHLRTGRHAALFSLGRLEEADEEFEAIAALRPDAIDRVAATAVQVRSLSHRTRFAEAIELGLSSLRELGVAVPAEGAFGAELDARFGHLRTWLESTDAAGDLARPDLGDPALLAAATVIDAVLPVAYFVADPALIAWLALEALRIWIEHGPGPAVVGPAGHAAYHAGPPRGDPALGYRALRRIVAVGEARGYEPGTSQARHMLAAATGWFEPIERGVEVARQAREGLIAGDDLAYAGYTYQLSVPYLADCAPTLDELVAEIDGGLAFLRMTGNEQTGQWLESYRWLVRTLRGEDGARGDEAPLDRQATGPLALLYAHLCHAVAAAVLGDHAGLAEHGAAAMELLPAGAGSYCVAQVRLLHGLALATQARAAEGAEREELSAALEELPRWMAARAADAPDNFLHLQRLLEAEQAWAAGDVQAAALAFDVARREAARRARRWHQALIAERAARFHFANGLEQTGQDLLGEARRLYRAWGAAAKVQRLDRAHPSLRPRAGVVAGDPDGEPARAAIAGDAIDLLGVLAASQAISSETRVERLNARVTNVLGGMTGATAVHLLLWSDERQGWLLPGQDVAGQGLDGDGEPTVPLSVLRYVQRTREPLVVSDATRDDRFAQDPYVTALRCCALLALPIISRGALQAALVLENHLIRDAFTAERLDAVKLIAGQLAVSLDNAQLYADYRRIADEQTALRRVATLVARGATPAAVLDAVAAEIEQLLDADGVSLGRYEPSDAVTVVAHRGLDRTLVSPGARFHHAGESVTAAVRRTGRPVRMDRLETATGPMRQSLGELGVRSSVGAPIVVDGRVWGLAVAYWRREGAVPPDSEQRIAQFAQLLETAIANADSRDQLIASRARLLTEGDAARRRVVRDLHDGAQQRLVHTIMLLKFAQQSLRDDDPTAAALVDEALDAAVQSNEELRELARGILPTVLTRGGLRAAVDAVVARIAVPVRVEVAEDRFAPEIEASAYFIVSEALTNVVKHARATRAEVTASVDDGMLHIEVRDDGIGGADPSSHGVVGMSDRAAALGGRLTVDSPPGAGTVVGASLPIAR